MRGESETCPTGSSSWTATLLGAAVAEARTRGFRRLSLWTPRDHGRARAFYEREGWAPTGREADGGELGLATVEDARAVR